MIAPVPIRAPAYTTAPQQIVTSGSTISGPVLPPPPPRRGAWCGTPGGCVLPRGVFVLAVTAGVLVETLVVDRELALDRHVVEGCHPARADHRETTLLVRVKPGQV